MNGTVIGPSLSYHTIELSSSDIEKLKKNKKLILTIVFNTADPNNHITLYDYHELDFKISAHLNATVNIP